MNCTECGQDVEENRFGVLQHSYQTHDAHDPVVE
jgi:hypothetical protein